MFIVFQWFGVRASKGSATEPALLWINTWSVVGFSAGCPRTLKRKMGKVGALEGADRHSKADVLA